MRRRLRWFLTGLSLVGCGWAPWVGATEAPKIWQLAPAPGCVHRCAHFFPRATGPALEQRWFQWVSLPEPGTLELPAGSYKLSYSRAGLHQTYVLMGPAVLELTGAQLRVLSPVRGHYEGHTPPQAPRREPPLVVPPLVAGVQGTRFEFLVSQQGTLLLSVQEGAVELGWQPELPGPPLRVDAGQGVLVARGDLLNRKLHPLTQEEAKAQVGALLAADAAVPRRGDQSAEGAFAEFVQHSLRDSPEQAARAAQAVADAWPQDAAAPHALFLAWQRAHSRSRSDLAEPLAGRLLEHYPHSVWTRLVDGVQPAGDE